MLLSTGAEAARLQTSQPYLHLSFRLNVALPDGDCHAFHPGRGGIVLISQLRSAFTECRPYRRIVGILPEGFLQMERGVFETLRVHQGFRDGKAQDGAVPPAFQHLHELFNHRYSVAIVMPVANRYDVKRG